MPSSTTGAQRAPAAVARPEQRPVIGVGLFGATRVGVAPGEICGAVNMPPQSLAAAKAFYFIVLRWKWIGLLLSARHRSNRPPLGQSILRQGVKPKSVVQKPSFGQVKDRHEGEGSA